VACHVGVIRSGKFQGPASRGVSNGEEQRATLESKNDLAALYKEQACYNDAGQLLLEAVGGRCLKLGDKHPHTPESMNNLIELYKSWGKPKKTDQWRVKLPREFATQE